MTVAQLIKKLEKVNPDAEVVIENDRLYNEGLYKATRIDSWDGWVKIDTDHKHLIEDY